MKKTIFASLTILTFSALMFCCSNAPKQEKVLRHVVMFGFKPEVSAQQIKEVEEAFCALPSQIDLIKGYEWGTDCSPEGLQQGLTHCFFLTFYSDADRDAYLIRPIRLSEKYWETRLLPSPSWTTGPNKNYYFSHL